jgi:hypothetical protein
MDPGALDATLGKSSLAAVVKVDEVDEDEEEEVDLASDSETSPGPALNLRKIHPSSPVPGEQESQVVAVRVPVGPSTEHPECSEDCDRQHTTWEVRDWELLWQEGKGLCMEALTCSTLFNVIFPEAAHLTLPSAERFEMFKTKRGLAFMSGSG